MASVAHWLIDIMLQLLSCFCIYQGLCEFIASCSKLMIRMVCLDWLTYLTIVVSRCLCEVRANLCICFQLWAPGSLGFTSTCIVIFDLYYLLILYWRGGWCLVCVGRWCWFWRARWYWISKWLNFYPHVQMEIVMICSVAWRALPFDSFSVLVLVCGFIQPPTVCNLNMFRTL